jgi:LysR family nitrogen assimilation transcriptional regulator
VQSLLCNSGGPPSLAKDWQSGSAIARRHNGNSRWPPGLAEWRTPINLRQLRYFCRTVEAGTITRAAEQLFVAQPALGMQIRQLEEETGVTLLTRHARGVSPTRAGQVLYERACEILRLVEDTERQVSAAARFEAKTVVLGLTNGSLNLAGRSLLQRVREKLSGVKIGLVEERSLLLVEAVEKHEVDIALAYEVHERPNLVRVPLIEEDMLFLTAARGGARGGLGEDIAFARVVEHELVLQGHRDGVREQLQACAKRLAVELSIVLDVSSVSMMKDLVVHGDAAAVMPYGNAIRELEQGLVRGQRIVDPSVKRTLYLVRSMATRLGPLATRLPALDRPLSEALTRLRSTTSSPQGSPP